MFQFDPSSIHRRYETWETGFGRGAGRVLADRYPVTNASVLETDRIGFQRPHAPDAFVEDLGDGRGDRRSRDRIDSTTDTGSGMTEEQLGRAFDLHYTTRAKGTGLGLPIARQIAIAHGGDLSIRSTLGVGTTVDVLLPRSPDATDSGSA